MEKKRRRDERKQQGNGDYEYLLVGKEEKTPASVVKSPPTVTRPHLNDSCVGPHGALTLVTMGNMMSCLC